MENVILKMSVETPYTPHIARTHRGECGFAQLDSYESLIALPSTPRWYQKLPSSGEAMLSPPGLVQLYVVNCGRDYCTRLLMRSAYGSSHSIRPLEGRVESHKIHLHIRPVKDPPEKY